jgi:hypothetical protein
VTKQGTNELPPYISRPTGYDLSLSGPYVQEKVSMRLFVLPGKKPCLEAACDRYLNGPLGEKRYTPLSHHVVMIVADMGHVYPSDRKLGSMHEIDVCFFVPVVRWDGDLPTGVGVFIPYLFVNNDWALVTGRQVLGFFKDLGISFSAKDVDSDDYQGISDLDRVEAWVMPETGEDSQLTRRRVLTWQRSDTACADETAHTFSSLGQVLEKLVEHLVGDIEHGIEHVVRDLLKGMLARARVQIPAVFLKQFRWEVDSTRAIYQRVIEADGAVRGEDFEGGGLLPGDWEITVTDYPSHPMASELGLTVNQAIVPELAIEVQFAAFTMEMVKP